MQKSSFWTLNKLIVLLTIGAYLMLMLELRSEHMNELGKHWQAWIPIVYSGIMVIIGIAGLWLWDKVGRKVLFWAFAVSIIVGLLGVWFHEKGKPWNSIVVVTKAWQAPIIKKGEKEPKRPKPPFAPLSFAGIGVLGMLACWKKG